jgi:hypothetical protein
VPQRVPKEVEADPVAMACLNEMMEACLEYAGHKGARGILRCIAARVATATSAESDVVPIRGSERAQHVLAAKVWLQGRLPDWLSRYG